MNSLGANVIVSLNRENRIKGFLEKEEINNFIKFLIDFIEHFRCIFNKILINIETMKYSEIKSKAHLKLGFI